MIKDRSNETTQAGISWVQFARCRTPFVQRWPSVFRMRLVKDQYDLVTKAGLPIRSVLDVGATDRVHEAKVRATWPGVDYRSFDIDRTNQHDYHDFADVDRQFDLVTLLEVLEHVPPKVAVELLQNCVKACRPGGWLLVSVPNVFTPGLQDEWTHIASLHYMDLGGLLTWSGCEVLDGARVYTNSPRHWLVHARLLHPLHRLLAVDYAQSIAMLARKP
jgi:SAM-dependent methyltransferase